MLNIRPAYKAAVKFLNHSSSLLSYEQLEAAKELKRRIKRMENDFNRLMQVNKLLCDAKIPKVHFDEHTSIITVTTERGSQSIKLNRKDPNIPVKLLDSTAIGVYLADDSEDTKDSEHEAELKMMMEQLLEHFYNNAFRVTKLVQVVTGKSKYHCQEITIVRNKLIEHPESGSLYSFGYGTNGPVVKPMYRGEKLWNDLGLIPNTESLINSLIEVFER